MKLISKPSIMFFIGLLLSLPAAWFILINILNELGYSQLFDRSWPTLQDWGVQEPIGWNINLLIVFGPLFALALNALSILQIRIDFSKEKIDCQLSVLKNWLNISVILLSGGALLILGTYLLLENCKG